MPLRIGDIGRDHGQRIAACAGELRPAARRREPEDARLRGRAAAVSGRSLDHRCALHSAPAWCGRSGSNRHSGLQKRILSPLRLPIPPRPRYCRHPLPRASHPAAPGAIQTFPEAKFPRAATYCRNWEFQLGAMSPAGQARRLSSPLRLPIPPWPRRCRRAFPGAPQLRRARGTPKACECIALTPAGRLPGLLIQVVTISKARSTNHVFSPPRPPFRRAGASLSGVTRGQGPPRTPCERRHGDSAAPCGARECYFPCFTIRRQCSSAASIRLSLASGVRKAACGASVALRSPRSGLSAGSGSTP